MRAGGLAAALWLAASAAASVSACHRVRPPLHAESPPGRWYVVDRGETLEAIARREGVPAEDILELNGLERAADVRPGGLIYVPREGPPEGAIPAALSAVRAGGLRWPLEGGRTPIASPFGARDGRPHEGIDLPVPIGTPVVAAADGRVVYAGDGIRGYGNLVVLQHAGGVLTVYAHASVLLVRVGQAVRGGDRVALSGQSGRATGPHLHFEVREGQIPRDPLLYLGP